MKITLELSEAGALGAMFAIAWALQILDGRAPRYERW